MCLIGHYVGASVPLICLGTRVIRGTWINKQQGIWQSFKQQVRELPRRELVAAVSPLALTVIATTTQTYWLPAVAKCFSERYTFIHLTGIVTAGMTVSWFAAKWLHEMGHLCAIKALFTDVNPSIKAFLSGGGECSWGGPGQELSKLGTHFSLNTARSLVAAAGPVAQIITNMLTSLVVYQMWRTAGVVADSSAFIGCMSAFSLLAYSLDKFETREPNQFVSHDFQCICNMSGIPRIHLFAITALLTVVPCCLTTSHLIFRGAMVIARL